MKPIIQQLLIELETGEQDIKLSSLLGINDYLHHPNPHEESYAAVVQQLIILLSKEDDHEVRKLLVRNIEGAYMCRISLEEINFEPVISVLDNSDSFFYPLCSVPAFNDVQ